MFGWSEAEMLGRPLGAIVPEVGQVVVSEADFDLGRMIAGLRELFAPRARTKQLTMLVDTDDLPRVRGDEAESPPPEELSARCLNEPAGRPTVTELAARFQRILGAIGSGDGSPGDLVIGLDQPLATTVEVIR